MSSTWVTLIQVCIWADDEAESIFKDEHSQIKGDLGLAERFAKDPVSQTQQWKPEPHP